MVNDITSKFTRAVEIKIESFEDYKKVIKNMIVKNKISYFYSEYHKELNAAEAEYGIPKEVIIGILAVESEFGRYIKSFQCLCEHVCRRKEPNLKELFRKRKSFHEMKSSYAGAMSYAQFIPWSLNKYIICQITSTPSPII